MDGGGWMRGGGAGKTRGGAQIRRWRWGRMLSLSEWIVRRMMTPDEFAARWRFSSLTKSLPEAVGRLPIATPSKRFLIESGLPDDPCGHGATGVIESLPPLSVVLDEEGNPCDEAEGYYLLYH